MKTLVTGGFGYLGSSLLRHLNHAGQANPATGGVRVLDNLQRGRFGGLLDLPRDLAVEFLQGDILDPVSVRRALEEVDAVVHLAAVVRTPFSFDHPETTEAVNHWGTSRLVELCLEAGVRRFIHASSASVYGSGEWAEESSAMQPVGPYSSSKVEAERVVQKATDSGLDVTILRFGTVYGLSPCMRFDAVPNRFAFLAAIGRPITVFGGGDQYRPLVHVKDAAEAIRLSLTAADRFRGQVFNVVSENLDVRQMALAAREAFPGARLVHTAQDAMTRISLQVSAQRLMELGWKPEVALQDGMKEMATRLGPFIQPPGAVFGVAVEG